MVCDINSTQATRRIELAGKCYEHGPALQDKEFLRALCPDTADDVVDKLVNATKNTAFGLVEGQYNEYCLFRSQYERICEVAMRETGGLAKCGLYRKYKPVVEAAVLYLLTESAKDNTLFGQRADETSDSFLIRQICADTFGITPTDRIFTITDTSATANYPFHVVPRVDVSSDETVYNTIAHEQLLLIMYYQSDLDPRLLETVSEYVNDNLGWRTPFDIYSHLQRGNMGMIPRPRCFVVPSGRQLDINAWCLETGETDIMPQGIEICKRKNIQELNVHA